MKFKLIYAVLAVFVSAQCLSAQDFSNDFSNEKSKVYLSLGATVGGDASFMESSDAGLAPSDGMVFGFNGGVAFNLRFLPRNARSTAETGILAIQPEIKYATAGCKLEETSLNLGYLMVPVMVQVYPVKSFYFEAGPEMALNLSHTPENFACASSQLNLSNLKANDIMLGIGLGMKLKGFTLGARYNIGFSDAAVNLPWRNNIIQLNVGYFFGLANKTALKINDDFDL